MNKYPFISWSGTDVLPRNIFENKIKELDYLLFFYDEDTYKLTASGALFDALLFEKPSIYLSNDYFDDAIGNRSIGYRCSSVDEMVKTVEKIIETGDAKYGDYVCNLRELKDKFSIKYNADLLKQQIHN